MDQASAEERINVLADEIAWNDALVTRKANIPPPTKDLTDTLPGGSEAFTTTILFEGGSLFFALKTANDSGFSALSNNAFWPRHDVYLPAVMRDYP